MSATRVDGRAVVVTGQGVGWWIWTTFHRRTPSVCWLLLWLWHRVGLRYYMRDVHGRWRRVA